MSYGYRVMALTTKTALISFLTDKVNTSIKRRKIDPSIVPVDYVVRILMEKIANGSADSVVDKECSKLLTIISK